MGTLTRLAALTTLVGLAGATLVGCSGDDGDSDAGSGASASSSASTATEADAGDDLCDEVTDTDLASWAGVGTTLQVGAAEEDGGTTTCTATSTAADSPVEVTWSVKQSPGSLEEEAKAVTGEGFKTSLTTLPSGADGIEVTGEDAGAKELYLLGNDADGALVTVAVTTTQAGGDYTVGSMRTIAANIAFVYTAPPAQ